jgi:hypothetical protein
LYVSISLNSHANLSATIRGVVISSPSVVLFVP